MPTGKPFRRVQGTSTPSTQPAPADVKRYPAPKMPEGPPGQARSPKPEHLGAARGTPDGGKKLPEAINRSAHSRAWGLEST